MRTLMTLVTLGAAGAGYVYLNQTTVIGGLDSTPSNPPALFDWTRAALSNPRVPATDLVQKIHEHTRSILDDMTKQHAGHSDAPEDDAFTRLQRVTQSTLMAANPTENISRETVGSTNNQIVPLPSFDELQRTAFNPASEKDSATDSAVQSAQASEEPAATAKPVGSTTANKPLEPTTTSNRHGLVQTGDSESGRTSTPISNTSTSTTKPSSKRIVGASAARDLPSKIAYEWKVVGKTTKGLPMHSAHLGETGTRTLVIAGLNGDDRTAVRWLELLAEETSRHPELLKNNEVVFFRAGNPDGLVHLKRENSRGVVINRNFPSRRYRPTADMPKFAVPASEVETRTILDTLYTFRPRRVIHLSATSGRSQVLYNRLAKNAAVEFENTAKVNISPLDAELYPGSVEDFAEGTLEAAVLSMRLSAGEDWNQAWNRLQPNVLTAVLGRSAESSWSDADPVFDPDRSPIPPSNVESVSRPQARRGYEELPPPPE